MGIELARLFMTVGADTSGAVQEMRMLKEETAQSAEAMKQAMQKGMLAVTAPVGIFGTRYLKQSVDQARYIQSTLARFRQVFGDQTNAAEAFVTELADGLGRSKTALRDSTSTFQAFFKGLGLGSAEATEFTKQITMAATDLAAFRDVSDREMMGRMISALSGSSEVLDQFGVNIKQTNLEKYLGGKSAKTATEIDKVRARIAAINDALIKQGAAGQAMREMGELSNRFKQFGAVLVDIKGKIGMSLLPIVRDITAVMTRVGNAVSSVVELMPDFAAYMLAGGTAAASLTGIVIGLNVALKMLGVTWKSFFMGAGLGLVFISIGVAIGAAVAGIQRLVQHAMTIKPVAASIRASVERLNATWSVFKKAMVEVGRVIYEVLIGIAESMGIDLAFLEDLPKTAAEALAQAMEAVTRFVLDAVSWFGAIVENWGLIWNNMGNIVRYAWARIGDTSRDMILWMGRMWVNFTGMSAESFAKMVNQIKTLWQNMITGLAKGLVWVADRFGVFDKLEQQWREQNVMMRSNVKKNIAIWEEELRRAQAGEGVYVEGGILEGMSQEEKIERAKREIAALKQEWEDLGAGPRDYDALNRMFKAIDDGHADAKAQIDDYTDKLRMAIEEGKTTMGPSEETLSAWDKVKGVFGTIAAAQERLKKAALERVAAKEEEVAAEEAEEAVEEKAKKKIEVSLTAGRYGIEQIGKKFQDTLLKGEGKDKQGEMVDVLNLSKEVQKKLLASSEESKEILKDAVAAPGRLA